MKKIIYVILLLIILFSMSSCFCCNLVTGMATNYLKGNKNEALLLSCESSMKNMATALEMYSADNDKYPETLDALTKPYKIDGKQQMPYMRTIPVSTFIGGEFKYTPPSNDKGEYVLYCSGKKNDGFSDIPENFPQYTPSKGFIIDPNQKPEERKLTDKELEYEKAEIDSYNALYADFERNPNEMLKSSSIEMIDTIIKATSRFKSPEGKELCKKFEDLKKKCLEAKKKLENPTSEREYDDYGYFLYNEDKYNDAIKVYDKGLKKYPKSLILLVSKGLALKELKKYKEAMKCYDQALKINPQYEYAWSSKGYTFEKQGKYKEAIQCYDKTLKIDPKDGYAWRHKGYSFEGQGKYKKAIQCYEQALKINPNDKDAKKQKEAALKFLNK